MLGLFEGTLRILRLFLWHEFVVHVIKPFSVFLDLRNLSAWRLQYAQ